MARGFAKQTVLMVIQQYTSIVRKTPQYTLPSEFLPSALLKRFTLQALLQIQLILLALNTYPLKKMVLLPMANLGIPLLLDNLTIYKIILDLTLPWQPYKQRDASIILNVLMNQLSFTLVIIYKGTLDKGLIFKQINTEFLQTDIY